MRSMPWISNPWPASLCFVAHGYTFKLCIYTIKITPKKIFAVRYTAYFYTCVPAHNNRYRPSPKKKMLDVQYYVLCMIQQFDLRATQPVALYCDLDVNIKITLTTKRLTKSDAPNLTLYVQCNMFQCVYKPTRCNTSYK